MNTRSGIIGELSYYLGYTPDGDTVAEAGDWLLYNPGSNLSEWVDAMKEIGAL